MLLSLPMVSECIKTPGTLQVQIKTFLFTGTFQWYQKIKLKGKKMESSHTSALLFTFEIFMTETTFSLCKDTVMPLHSEKDPGAQSASQGVMKGSRYNIAVILTKLLIKIYRNNCYVCFQ